MNEILTFKNMCFIMREDKEVIMKYVYNKLVRDKIPEAINKKGDRKANYRILNNKEFIEELNDSAIDYNVDVLKRNAIILTYYPNASDDLLFKEVATIDLELITAENVNTMLELYKEEQTAVMEFNDALLEYYREILQ